MFILLKPLGFKNFLPHECRKSNYVFYLKLKWGLVHEAEFPFFSPWPKEFYFQSVLLGFHLGKKYFKKKEVPLVHRNCSVVKQARTLAWSSKWLYLREG